MQVTVPGLQSRCQHRATVFSLRPGLNEVVIFGGYSEWPSNFKSLADITPIANTTVLRFGEYTSFGVWVMHVLAHSIPGTCTRVIDHFSDTSIFRQLYHGF